MGEQYCPQPRIAGVAEFGARSFQQTTPRDASVLRRAPTQLAPVGLAELDAVHAAITTEIRLVMATAPDRSHTP